LTCPHGKACRK